MKSSDGSSLTERFRLSQGGFNFTGLSTHTGNFDLDGDLDVDGHTNLDNVNIAGVTTITGTGGNGLLKVEKLVVLDYICKHNLHLVYLEQLVIII